MKNLLLTAFVFTSLFATAQDCGKYYYFQSNKTITMGMFDRHGGDNGKVVYTVGDLSGDSIQVKYEAFSSKGKSMGKSNNIIKCSNGVLMLDMKMVLPPQQDQGPFKDQNANATISGSFLEYPATMNIGDKLKDGSFSATSNNNGPKSSFNFDIYDRKVAGKESITTPAGTWDCFKITYTSKVKIKSGPFGSPAFGTDGTEWYAPGFGVVQIENKFGSTKLVSIQ